MLTFLENCGKQNFSFFATIVLEICQAFFLNHKKTEKSSTTIKKNFVKQKIQKSEKKSIHLKQRTTTKSTQVI